MSQATVALDRVVTFALGVALIAAGVLGLSWYYGWWDWTYESVDSTEALDATATDWWPWALGAAAVVLFLLGLRWLFAHMPGRAVSELRLPGSGSEGRLEVDASNAVSAACAELRRRPDFRSAQGVIRRDRGQLLIDIRATLEPSCQLGEVASAIDETTAALARSLERPDLYCRVRLDVGGRDRSRTSAVR